MGKYKKWFLDVVYVGGSFGGAALIASNIGMNALGYVLFLMSSVAGIFLLRGSNASKSLMLVTVYYAVVNSVGIVRYMQ